MSVITPTRPAPRANVPASTHRARTPRQAAMPRFWVTARMRRPKRVRANASALSAAAARVPASALAGGATAERPAAARAAVVAAGTSQRFASAAAILRSSNTRVRPSRLTTRSTFSAPSPPSRCRATEGSPPRGSRASRPFLPLPDTP